MNTKYFTVVYKGVQPGMHAASLGEHPLANAMSWSHAIDEKNAAQGKIAELTKQRAELLDALNALFSNEHMELVDLIYTVREREGKGWDGEWVNHWSTSVSKAKELLAELGQ